MELGLREQKKSPHLLLDFSYSLVHIYLHSIKSFLPRNFACYVLWISLSKGVGWMLLSRSLGHGSQSRETREPSRPEPIRERRGRGGRG
ncbi:hypothetical protein BHE74_00019125 [Ensete ventricosum]|nr:hypothetical protein BHE74_00019125 [Ensete ventricosum]